MEAKGLIVASVASATDRRLDAARPAPLLPVANQPILFHTLGRMSRAGIVDIGITVPSGDEPALRAAVGGGERFGVRVSYVTDDGAAGLGGALLAAQEFLGSTAFVLQMGDGIATHDLSALLPGVVDSDALLLVHRAGPRRNGLTGLESLRLLHMAQSSLPEETSLSVAGLQMFGPGFMDAAREPLRARNGDLTLGDLLDALRKAGGRVEPRLLDGWFPYRGRAQDLLDMNRELLEQLESDPVEPDLPGTRVQGRVAIDPTATVESTVIRGPAIIGAGARVVQAYIGPYTAIGDNVHIEGAEIEHSIVLAGAQILHVGGRLEASVVGRDARVFRDFSLPRALRLNVGDGVEVALG